MRVKFRTSLPQGMAKYIDVLSRFGQVSPLLKRGRAPEVVVDLSGGIVQLYDMMRSMEVQFVLSENTDEDETDIPVVVEMIDHYRKGLESE